MPEAQSEISSARMAKSWESDDKNPVWHWDKPGAPDPRESRYFMELIAAQMTGRQNWFALAQV
jgi:hypothetical protein